MSRAPLPARYASQLNLETSRTVNPMASSSGWSSDGDGVLTDVLNNTFGGNPRAVHMTADAGTSHIIYELFTAVDISEVATVQVALYFDSHSHAVSSKGGDSTFRLDFGTTPVAGDRYQVANIYNNKATKGWNIYTFVLSDFTLTGSPDLTTDRKSTRLNSSHTDISRMPSSA